MTQAAAEVFAEEVVLEIDTPEWAEPLLAAARFKGAKGGRSGGKSHERAESLVEAMILDENLSVVCIRESQKSLKFSAKKLIEQKIRKFNVGHLFKITNTEINRIGGEGVCIFQGMQDHTADSIKSLEGFGIAWVEEAQNLSARSMELLIPTIRMAGSELWFTWNPDNADDPVEVLFKDAANDPDFVCVHINFYDNPYCTAESVKDAERHQRVKPESYGHVWLGEYNLISDNQVFANKFRIAEFAPAQDWDGPYHGVDFGFSNDPTTGVKCWVHRETLYIERDGSRVGLELDDTSDYLIECIPEIDQHTIRADCARPESISYLKRNGLPRIVGCKKGAGSVQDGIEFMKSFREIVIHTRCKDTASEFNLYSYKIDKLSGDILPIIIDAYNHCIDAIRYALEPLMKRRAKPKIRAL